MREKINEAVRGNFQYEKSEIAVAPKELHLEVNAGEQCEGSFVVTNHLGREMRGAVTSDCHFMEFKEEMYQGVENEIFYCFHGENILSGETIKGHIQILSDCGTRTIPFQATVGVPSCQVSSGRIRDLFHFTNLAKEETAEASTLFRSPHFADVFLYRDKANLALYRGLSQGSSKGMAMEEFLIAIHKKLPIQISINKTSFQYSECEKEFMAQFVITKNNWGYGEYHIKSDSEFIVPERKIVWTDDFIGDNYSVSFVVKPELMLPGRNYARIVVSSVRQKIEITIVADKNSANREIVRKKKAKQEKTLRLMQLYVDFGIGKITSEEYIQEVSSIINTIEQSEASVDTQIFRIHLGIMEHCDQMVKAGLANLEARLPELEQGNTEIYCSYLYLKGLWTDDEETIQSCVSKIREKYKADKTNWKLLWFLLYLDPSYRSERRKYDRLLKQLERNCYSPILYLEVCSIVNDSPDLLMTLTDGLLRALHWGCRQGFLEKEAALRYCYLSGKLRDFSNVVWKDMEQIYEKYPEDEVLAAICKMLMKGQITSSKAFRWYNLGVEHNLKLTDLYEYYMYSIDEKQQMKLQDSTLLYFLYDNHLTVSKKAMLYAYVIRHKAALGDIYEAYLPVMKEYTFRQLEASKISSNLAVLYEEFITEETLTEVVAKELPKVMFAHEIICNNRDIVGVYVTHSEIEGEEFVPFVNGKAIVSIFTENYSIFLADSIDNRYALSIDYTANKLLNLDYLAEKCLERNSDDYRLILYLYDKAERLNQVGKNVMEVRRKVLEIPNLNRHYYRKSFCALIRYYFDNFESELLDTALEQLDWDLVSSTERKQFIEYCAIRRVFPKAMEGIMRYGYEEIDEKRLLQIASETFAEQIEQENATLVKLAWHIFKSGHFDENMMRYLCRYYSGGIHEMTSIWKFAKGFEIETGGFEERILGQIIFTGEMSPEGYEVFYQYYEMGKDKRLIWGFMKFIAYQYLVQNWMIPKKMFEYFYKEVQVQENIFCLIACLKYFSQRKDLSEEEMKFADYHVNQLYEKNMIFPFFRDFYGRISLPVHILDEHYVEYIANPEYEVNIHYLISSGYNEGQYVKETMRDVFQGIRVKEFVLFHDEILQYYISEVRPEGEVITQSVSVSFDETMDNERTSSRYHLINLMMIAQEMNEEKTLIDMMREYAEVKECTKSLFKPIL